jgi:hypothetical protein
VRFSDDHLVVNGRKRVLVWSGILAIDVFQQAATDSEANRLVSSDYPTVALCRMPLNAEIKALLQITAAAPVRAAARLFFLVFRAVCGVQQFQLHQQYFFGPPTASLAAGFFFGPSAARSLPCLRPSIEGARLTVQRLLHGAREDLQKGCTEP